MLFPLPLVATNGARLPSARFGWLGCPLQLGIFAVDAVAWAATDGALPGVIRSFGTRLRSVLLARESPQKPPPRPGGRRRRHCCNCQQNRAGSEGTLYTVGETQG